MSQNMSENMQAYVKEHTRNSGKGGYFLCDSKKSAVIISLLGKPTMFEKVIYYQGKRMFAFKKT